MLCWERQMCQSERAVSSETRGGQSLHGELKLNSSKPVQEKQVDLFMVKHNLGPISIRCLIKNEHFCTSPSPWLSLAIDRAKDDWREQVNPSEFYRLCITNSQLPLLEHNSLGVNTGHTGVFKRWDRALSRKMASSLDTELTLSIICQWHYS